MAKTAPSLAAAASPSGDPRKRAGDLGAAIKDKQLAVQTHPQDAKVWHALGIACIQAGQFSQAIDAIDRAILLDGSKASFRNNLGVAFLGQRNWPAAHEAFEKAVALDPRYVDAFANLGLVCVNLTKLTEAARYYRRALEIQPQHVGALFNLGNLLLEQGRAEEAIVLYRLALDVRPQRCDILNNLGRALLEKGQTGEAIACFDKALRIDPGFGEAAFNAGKAYAQQEKLAQAEERFEAAAFLRPGKGIWRWQRLGLCPTIFQSEAELDDYRADLDRRLDRALALPVRIDVDELAWDGVVPSFNLAHHGRSNRQLFEKFAALYRPHIPKRNPAVHNRGKKRVGFVVTAPHFSSFLRTQGGIVENLDPALFEVVVCCGEAALGRLRQEIRRTDVTWAPFSSRFSDAAEDVAATACDVLYFHKVSTDALGYLLPFARLAPVQCTSWTTHFTSGVTEVDYYLSSVFVEAPEADQEYTEKLVRLEAFPGLERSPVPVPPSCRTDFGLPAEGSLYLCPQRLPKFHPDQDALFRRVLDEDSSGHLVMLSGQNDVRLAQLLKRFGKTLGSAAKRVIVLPPQTPLGVRQLMSVCDALLDIRHYSASLMGKDAVAVGLPVVTWPGKFKVERYMLGFYRRFGISDLITDSAEEYVRLAVRLGKDADFRRDLQERIKAASPLLFEERQAVLEFERFVLEAKPRQSM